MMYVKSKILYLPNIFNDESTVDLLDILKFKKTDDEHVKLK